MYLADSTYRLLEKSLHLNAPPFVTYNVTARLLNGSSRPWSP